MDPCEDPLVKKAYQVAQVAHQGQLRDEGIPYFEHPLAVVRILIDECQITDPDLLAAAFLHDVLEDTDYYQNLDQLEHDFNEHIAKLVDALTKAEDKKASAAKLGQASSEAILLKMADRLHNLRTLHGVSADKKQRQINETKELLLPIFVRAVDQFPDQSDYLIKQIRAIIQNEDGS